MRHLVLLIDSKLYNKVNSFRFYKMFKIKILITFYYEFASTNEFYELTTKLLYNCSFICASYNNTTMRDFYLYRLLFEANCVVKRDICFEIVIIVEIIRKLFYWSLSIELNLQTINIKLFNLFRLDLICLILTIIWCIIKKYVFKKKRVDLIF